MLHGKKSMSYYCHSHSLWGPMWARKCFSLPHTNGIRCSTGIMCLSCMSLGGPMDPFYQTRSPGPNLPHGSLSLPDLHGSGCSMDVIRQPRPWRNMVSFRCLPHELMSSCGCVVSSGCLDQEDPPCSLSIFYTSQAPGMR